MAEVKVESNPRYLLSLSHVEAEVLYDLCQEIAGSPKGPRGVFDAISEGLEQVGVICRQFPKEFRDGELYYKDVTLYG